MATDPGDLVLDPTCGSGTTAYVAEQWGRRWITIDTSRVALALGSRPHHGCAYPYYLLADSRDGQTQGGRGHPHRAVLAARAWNIRQGFVYERVPHVTLKSIANNAEIDVIWENWQATLEPLRETLNKARHSREEKVARSGRSRAKPMTKWPDAGEETARRLVASPHRPAERNRRLHRGQGRV